MTSQQAMAIESMWAQGILVKHIARKTGLCKNTIYSYAYSHRGTCPKRIHKSANEERWDRVREMAAAGCDYRDVMREFGVARSTAGHYLTAARLELGI